MKIPPPLMDWSALLAKHQAETTKHVNVVPKDILKLGAWGLNLEPNIYIYIYPWLYPFAGGHNGVGWGGVGWVGLMTFLAREHIFNATEMMTFLAHEHIFDATEMMTFFAHVHIFDATENWGGLGWGGVGLMTLLAHEHIFDATEMMTFLAHEHIFDATESWGGLGWGGVGLMTFLAHEHIFDATEMMTFLAHEHKALHRKPGIMSVLNALQLYRNDCSSGKICVAPKDAFVPDSLSWLD